MKFHSDPAVNIVLTHTHYTTSSGDCCLMEGIESPMDQVQHAEHVVALIREADRG